MSMRPEKRGVGKSTLTETLARQDLEAGRGFVLVDPHGDLVESIAASIPPDQMERIVYAATSAALIVRDAGKVRITVVPTPG